MFTSLNLIYFVMFLFPGGFIKLLLDKFAPKRDKKYTSLMEASLLLSFSFLVVVVNFIILMIAYRLPPDLIITETIGATIFSIEDFGFIFSYVLLSFITCPLIAFAWHYFNKYPILLAVNKYNQKTGKLQETHGDNVFDSIFNHNALRINFYNKPVVSVEKNHKVLVRGRLLMFSGDGTENREIVVNEAEITERYFERDSKSETKIFEETIAQYCDLENGLVVRIYEMSKFNDYVNKFTSSNKTG